MKICFAASSGGHYEQLMMLKPLMEEYDSFVVTEQTDYSAKAKGEKTYYMSQVNRREKDFVWKMLKNAWKSLQIYKKEKPDVVICTGVLAMIPMCLIAKMMGKKLIYIESFAKVTSPTETGKLLYKFADQFYVQWESDARNYGKNLAKGDYIAFVDSDDYVHLDMYRRLVSVMDDKNADICCCGYYRTSLDGHEVSSVFGACVSMDGIHAAKDLINQVAFNNFAWNKLYKKELFNEINFPVGRTYEDILTTYKVFMKAKIVVGIEDPLYYYVENSSSISSSLTNIIGLWESVNEQMQQMVEFFPELKNDCDRRIVETAKYIIIKYLQAGYNRNSDEMANIKRQLSLQANDFEYSIKKYAYRIIRFPRIYYMIYKFKILYMKLKKNIKG